MNLYLSKANPEGRSSGDQQGEQRSGKYVARVQIGYEKDNSPKYRYFKTVEEYKKYLAANGGKKDGDGKQDKLKDKVDKEHKGSKKKQQKAAKERARSLFVSSKKDSKKSDEKKVKKSLYLYIRRGL